MAKTNYEVTENEVFKLVRENEQLRHSLRELVDVLTEHLNQDSWITTLHKVQHAQILLGIKMIGEDDGNNNSNN